jgi:hypothetical protein
MMKYLRIALIIAMIVHAIYLEALGKYALVTIPIIFGFIMLAFKGPIRANWNKTR